jgi:DnaK suppressor protein
MDPGACGAPPCPARENAPTDKEPAIKEANAMDLDKVELPEGYRPSLDEEYMCGRQLAYFRRLLLEWKERLIKESESTLSRLKEEALNHADAVDRGTAEAETAFELRTRDRYRKLIKKIDNSIERIEDGTYGYCEETEEPIGIRRLEARPIATLSIKAQEAHEREERLGKILKASMA